MVQILASQEIEASREAVFAVLVDYQRRPALVPTNVTDYTIKRGGHGADTLVRYRLHLAGRVRDCRMEVTEPVAGCELVESDTASSLRTRWTLDPTGPGRCRVHVQAHWATAGGLVGAVERVLASRGLRRTYTEILTRLARQPKLRDH